MIIGISGKIGSGKDTVAEIIQYLSLKNLPNRPDYVSWKQAEAYSNKVLQELSKWEIKKFAGKLKEICSILTSIPVEDFEKEEVKNQLLGEEWAISRNAITGETFAGGYYKLHIPTVRWLLQTVGTEAMRDKIHENVWVNALFADYKPVSYRLKDPAFIEHIDDHTEGIYPNWIITDVRFPNELKAIADRGGICVRINRDINFRKRQIGAAGLVGDQVLQSIHPSETSLDNAKFDYTIENDGTIEELIEKVRIILKQEKII